MGSPSRAPEHPLHEGPGEGSLVEGGSGIASNTSITPSSLNLSGGARVFQGLGQVPLTEGHRI